MTQEKIGRGVGMDWLSLTREIRETNIEKDAVEVLYTNVSSYVKALESLTQKETQ